MMYGNGYGVFGVGWMWIFWIFLLVVLIVIVALALGRRGRGDRPGGPPHEQTPEQILKARYARGEIDREEYTRRLEDLRR